MKTFRQFIEEKEMVDESKYDGAVDFFINYQNKHGGDMQRNLVKTSRIVRGIDYRTLERVLHDLINRNRIDKKYGFRKDLLK